jgi:hypothetical protein
MEIGKFKLAKADLVRPPNKPAQEQIIPKQKPYTEKVFKLEVDDFIKGFIGGFPKDEMLLKIQSVLDKAVDAGAIEPQEGIKYLRERKQQLVDFARENYGQELPGIEEDRENFKYGTVPGEGNSKINYDPETNTYRKRVQETIDGKKTNKYIYSEPGQSLEDFKQTKPVRSTGAIDATVKARQYIDGWTKNWFDNNLKNYGVKDFEVMLNDLSNDWNEVLESTDAPKASAKFNLSTPELNLPNITSGKDATIKKGGIEPFTYNDVRFYTNLEGSKDQLSKTLSQYKKVFYKNKIETDPQLRTGLNEFFDFMSADKRGLYKKLDGKTIKDFMNTVSDDVKFLLDPEISGLDKASKNKVFNSYDDLADNYNKFTQDKVRLKAVQAETEAIAKAGKKTADQYKKVKADIAKQNDVLAKMSVEDIAKNKKLLNSVRMVIDPKTGEVSYTNYTVKDPKAKPALTDLELAEKIKQKAKDKNFYVTEHIGKKSLNKANLAFPNNIQSANYMSNSQLENARRFLINPENRNTSAAQNLDKTLEDLRLTIRGPEYGSKPIGNKMNIVFDSKTGKSNIVENQLINKKPIISNLTETISGVTTADKLDKPPAAVERDMFEKANERFKKQKGVMLGSAGDLDTAARLVKEDFQTAKKLFGEYAPQIARASLPAIKLLLAETGIGAAFVPMDIASGLTTKEVLTNLATLGVGVPFKDIQERGKFVEEKGLGPALQSALRKKMIPQNMRPALNLPVDFGKPQQLTEPEQQAMQMFETEAKEPIESRRKKLAEERVEKYSDPEFGFRGGAMNGGIMRLGFADGPKDPTKRKFIKAAAGIASIPILGRLIKPATKAIEAAAPAIQKSVEGIPDFLTDLIAKVKLKAEATGMKYFTGNRSDEFTDVYQADNFIVKEKGNKITLREVDDPDRPGYRENQIELEVDPETGGVTYNEASVRPDAEGKLKDVEEYIEEDDLENMRKYTYDE